MNIQVYNEGKKIQDLLAKREYQAVYSQYAPVLQNMLFVQSLEEWLDFIQQEGTLEEDPLRLYLSAWHGECLLLGCYEGEVTQKVLDCLNGRIPEQLLEKLKDLPPIVLDMDELGGTLEKQIVPYQETAAPFGVVFHIDFEDIYCAGAYFLSIGAAMKGEPSMRPWFTTEQLAPDTWVISEYRHWEETHCYLLIGEARALLIDTGLGICSIYDEVRRLTDKPITAIATHIHWDHIGGHKYFPDFCAHEAELPWLQGEFPLSIETVREMVLDRCDPPDGFDVSQYEMFQGTPARVLRGGEVLDLGGRTVRVLHTPGHSPGHLCFWEEARGDLYTGDLIYLDTLFAYYPSTDPEAYLASLETVAALPARRVLPAHHSLEVPPRIPAQMRDALRQLKRQGNLRHGAGTFQYDGWAIWL